MLHLGNNIKTIRELANLTQSEFAEKFHVKSKKGEYSSDKIYTYENNKAEPPPYLIRDIAEFAGVSIEDLKNTELSRDEITFSEKKYTINNIVTKTNDTETPFWKKRQELKNGAKEIYFPVYEGNTRLREDDKLIVYNDDPEMQTPVGFLPQHLFPGCDHAEKAFGNSMYPRVVNQGLVAGKIVDKNKIVFGEMYGMHLEGGSPPVIKYVQQCSEEDCILLVSENKSIKDQVIKIDDIKLMYRVIYIINPA